MLRMDPLSPKAIAFVRFYVLCWLCQLAHVHLGLYSYNECEQALIKLAAVQTIKPIFQKDSRTFVV